MTSKLTFIVAVDRFDYNSGGNHVLHYLATLLNRIGEKVYTLGVGKPGSLYPQLSITNFDPKTSITPELNSKENIILNKLDKKSTIIIIPEGMDSKYFEPYGNILRWVLYFNENLKYNSKELLFYFHEGYNINNFVNDGILRIQFMDRFFWKNKNQRRNLSSFLIKKGTYHHDKNTTVFDDNISSLKKISNSDNLIYLDRIIYANSSFDLNSSTKNDLLKIFNDSKYFLSFDNFTAYSIFAASCGCKSIIIPYQDLKWTPNEFRRLFPSFAYGIAYGFDDLDHMEKTLHKVPDFIKDLEQDSLNQVKNLVKVCQNKI